MTDYLWEQEECQQQRNDTITYKRGKDTFFFPKNRLKREQNRRKKVYLFNLNFDKILLYFISITGIESKLKYK